MRWGLNYLKYVFYFVYKTMYFTKKAWSDASPPISAHDQYNGIIEEQDSTNEIVASVCVIISLVEPEMSWILFSLTWD